MRHWRMARRACCAALICLPGLAHGFCFGSGDIFGFSSFDVRSSEVHRGHVDLAAGIVNPVHLRMRLDDDAEE